MNRLSIRVSPYLSIDGAWLPPKAAMGSFLIAVFHRREADAVDRLLAARRGKSQHLIKR